MQEDGAIEIADEPEEKLIFTGPVAGLMRVRAARLARSLKLHAAPGIDEHQHEVARLERLVNFLQHAAVEVRTWFMHAGRIDKDDLCGGMRAFVCGHFDDAGDAIPRGLRLGGDNGNLFASEGVEQRALAGIGPAQNGDES